MVLFAHDKTHVHNMFEHIKGHEEVYGAEALYRMFSTDFQTKTYFAGKDLSEGSSFLHSHGKKVLSALTSAEAHMDDLDGALSKLSDKHADELMVDPTNFPRLCHHILVVLAIHMGHSFTAPLHVSMDKFMAAVSAVLVSKYR